MRIVEPGIGHSQALSFRIHHGDEAGFRSRDRLAERYRNIVGRLDQNDLQRRVDSEPRPDLEPHLAGWFGRGVLGLHHRAVERGAAFADRLEFLDQRPVGRPA